VYQLGFQASAKLRQGIITRKLIAEKMSLMADHLDSKNLVPFSRRRRNGFQLPGAQKDRDEEMLEQVDPDLTAEDEGVIRRYLHYADTLLGGPEKIGLALVPDGGTLNPLAVPEKSDVEPRDGTQESPERAGKSKDNNGNQAA
jgi:hypothetical protein